MNLQVVFQDSVLEAHEEHQLLLSVHPDLQTETWSSTSNKTSEIIELNAIISKNSLKFSNKDYFGFATLLTLIV